MPLVSVIVPAFRSGATIAASVASLERQTFRDFEVVVVESGGDTNARELPVRWIGTAGRLFPQAARNLGVDHARGELLAFTDPDIYLDPHWLERLVAAWRARGGVIVGAFAQHGSRWTDTGFHFCKFSKWLPGAPPCAVDMAPSGNMLLARADFERAGRFPGELFVGDVELSRRLRELGVPLWFEPAAIGAHHHLYGVAEFLRERFTRGRLYGELRREWYRRRPVRRLVLLAATVLPIRLARNIALVASHAARSRRTAAFLTSLPIILLGYTATLTGEARGLAR
ncbi:MAG TPA: glycosyltransferase [Thermoanaerobaculia bacterium]